MCLQRLILNLINWKRNVSPKVGKTKKTNAKSINKYFPEFLKIYYGDVD